MSEAKQETSVSNLNQAISVLMQAAEQGRRAGIYEWEDLDYISQSLKCLCKRARRSIHRAGNRIKRSYFRTY